MFINTLTISAQDAISRLSWLQIHPWFGLIIATLIAILLLGLGIGITVKFLPVEIGAFLSIGLFSGTLLIFACNTFPSNSQIKMLQDTPTKTLSVDKYPIVSAKSASSQESDLSGNIFYVQGSSTDSTAYRYFIKTDNNIYQQHTLKEQFGNHIKAKNIYVKEDSHVKPMLVVKKVTYADKQVRSLLSDNGHSTTKTTYTFNVPKHSVVTDFNFK